MKTRAILLIIVIVSALPLLMNVAGTNIFLYLGLNKKLVIAASQGVCHLAITTESSDTDMSSDIMEIYDSTFSSSQILKIGPFDLFTEKRLDPMFLFRFDMPQRGSDYDYSAIEFPWLMITLVPIAIWVWAELRKKRNANHSA